MNTEITEYDDIIDGRDVINRIDELHDELLAAYNGKYTRAQKAWMEWLDDVHSALADEPFDPPTFEAWVTAVQSEVFDIMHETAEQYLALKALAEDAEESVSDWRYGETMVRESYFRDYARQLAEDVGAIDSNTRWPNNCIDWERAARELRADYRTLAFKGVTYLCRG